MSICKHCGENLKDSGSRCWRCGYENAPGAGDEVVSAREVTEQPLRSPPRVARYPRHASAVGGGIAAVTLGGLGLLVGVFSPLAVIGVVLGGLGFPLGLWGMLSHHQRTAVIGLALCLLAMLLGTVRGVAQLDQMIRDTKPADPTIEQVTPLP